MRGGSGVAKLAAGLAASALLVAGLLPTPAGAQGLRAGHARAVAVTPTRTVARLGPLENIPQTWNNCGPASVAEVLAYWGIDRTQGDVQAVLRADGNPHGMAPYGVPAYARSLGLRALLGIAGTPGLVKALVSNGFPVIVSQWISLADHYGHYRPIQGYDDRQAVFDASDPYLGQDHLIGYAEFAQIWASTNGRFMVLYPPTRQALLDAVLASARWVPSRAFRQDLAREHRLLEGTVPDRTGYGSPRNYYLAIAWDELQLGQTAAARRDLALGAKAGASPVVVGWIAAELSVR